MASSNILTKEEFMELTDNLKPYTEKIGELTIANLDDYVQKNKPSEKKARESNDHQQNV
jgi:hypothetical protein